MFDRIAMIVMCLFFTVMGYEYTKRAIRQRDFLDALMAVAMAVNAFICVYMIY